MNISERIGIALVTVMRAKGVPLRVILSTEDWRAMTDGQELLCHREIDRKECCLLSAPCGTLLAVHDPDHPDVGCLIAEYNGKRFRGKGEYVVRLPVEE